MKLLNFNIIKLTLYFIIGIALAFYYAVPTSLSLLISLSCIILLSVIYYIDRKKHKKTIGFGVTVCLTAISLGLLVTNLHHEKRHTTHYSHFQREGEPITFRIKTLLKPSLYSDKYTVDLLKIGNTTVTGKALLNISKSDSTSQLDVDHLYVTKAALSPIKSASNPHQFDYKSYLEKQYIYNQIFTNPSELLLIQSKSHTVYGYADRLRKHINQSLETHSFSTDELAIINALLLGQRQDVSKDIVTHYVNAGAIHILAVSGLHVGIILYLLTLVFKPMHRIKNGKHISGLIIIILLWCFAVVAGLSSSVTRAVTMFSIVAFAMHLKRPTNIYNTLAFSILVLTLFKPLIIFDVGFQLSYLAVLAIVSIQPLLANLWNPKYKVTQRLWDVFTVTLAAQFGVLPISLFYFHQIPSLFFIANLIVIPFLGGILSLGIIVIILASLHALPTFLADLYGGIITLMNTLMAWISDQNTFLIEGISFNKYQMFLAYIVIVFFVSYIKNGSYKWLRMTLITIVLFYGVLIYSEFRIASSNFTIFHKSRYTILGKKVNKKLYIDSNLEEPSTFSSLNSFITENRISLTKHDTLSSIYHYNNNYLLVIDSLGIYKIPQFRPKYILLSNSPKINLNRVINTLQPKVVIADGSNYKSYVARWKATCQQQNISFHSTYENNAYTLD